MFGMHDMRALTPPPDSSEVAEMPVHKTAGGDLVYAGSVAQQLEAVLNTLDVDACEAGGGGPF